MADSIDPMSLVSKIKNAEYEEGLPPVEKWNPECCGDIDMRIARDGTWLYMGTPIGRKAMVRLFSTVLRYDDDGQYYLVTPVEKIGITVDDAPFVAVLVEEKELDGQKVLEFETNIGDKVIADREHPIRVDFDSATQEPSPYVTVRRNLQALISRSLFYQLVEMAEEKEVSGNTELRLTSAGESFVIGRC